MGNDHAITPRLPHLFGSDGSRHGRSPKETRKGERCPRIVTANDLRGNVSPS